MNASDLQTPFKEPKDSFERCGSLFNKVSCYQTEDLLNTPTKTENMPLRGLEGNSATQRQMLQRNMNNGPASFLLHVWEVFVVYIM